MAEMVQRVSAVHMLLAEQVLSSIQMVKRTAPRIQQTPTRDTTEQHDRGGYAVQAVQTDRHRQDEVKKQILKILR
jgi:sensor domain CHASE-containing protein